MSFENAPDFSMEELNRNELKLSPEIEYNLGILAEALQGLRDFSNRRLNRPVAIHVNCGYDTQGHKKRSQHYRGLAADIVLYDRERGRIHVRKQYEIAVKSGLFTGIGAYPYWHNPGLHVDLGPARGHWYEPMEGRPYLALNEGNIDRVLGVVA